MLQISTFIGSCLPRQLEQSPGTTGGTTYVSDSASVWKDVPEMTKSVNVKGGKILIVFHGEVVIRVSQQVRTRVLVDGVVQSGSDRSLVQGNDSTWPDPRLGGVLRALIQLRYGQQRLGCDGIIGWKPHC